MRFPGDDILDFLIVCRDGDEVSKSFLDNAQPNATEINLPMRQWCNGRVRFIYRKIASINDAYALAGRSFIGIHYQHNPPEHVQQYLNSLIRWAKEKP